MPSFETPADIFTHLSVFHSPKGSSNTFKTHKNISLYFKRKYLIIYKLWYLGKKTADFHIALHEISLSGTAEASQIVIIIHLTNSPYKFSIQN